ncbi:MAG: multicopper oxidase family protein [Vicinamibacterales bacterium]
MERREFLITTALAAGAGLAGCRRGPTDARAPARPAGTGRVHPVQLTTGPVDVDLGTGAPFTVFGYNGRSPGPEIRVREGDTLRVTLDNQLPEPTTIHWHGIPLPNGMDGVPGLTQQPAAPGEPFVYEFMAWPSGTYFYHSHVGYQLDQGLHGPLVIEPAREPGHDREFVLMLEDWAAMDGGGPAASRAGRIDESAGGGMMDGMMGGRGMGGGMMGGGMGRPRAGESEPLRQPLYDAYTINGRSAGAAEPLRVKRGDRVRLRIVNAASSTTFVLRLAGHRLTATHVDGRPVEAVEADVLRVGMGERYDAEFVADNPGRWALLGAPEGAAEARPLRTLLYDGVAAGELLREGPARPRSLTYDDLVARPEDGLPATKRIDRTVQLTLSGGMMGSPYWTINGERYPDTAGIDVERGERVRLEYFNMSMMAHPMHLHGHFFELDLPGRPRKDTVLVERMMGRMAVEFVADNPGRWFHHCHNLYHMEAGMANVIEVGG